MMGLGWQELLIVLVIIMIVFGAGKLPEIGSALGRGVKEFKAGTGDEGPVPVAAGVRTGKGRAIETREIRADRT